MNPEKKNPRELKKQKRMENERDSAPVVVLRVIWFLIKFVIGAAATVLLVALVAGVLFSVTMAGYLKNDVLTTADMSLDDYSLNQTSFIYCFDPETGEEKQLQRIYATENRIWADYEEFPQSLIDAAVAMEDKRFYEHQGVDWVRTVKACAQIFIGSGDLFGGSTVTQQLIKNLTEDDEVTVRRKLQEIFRALQFEKKYTKEEIMTWYLNTIYLGQGAYGVKSAANVYFAKTLDELTPAECACLISITNNPSLYDPYIRPENNKERREDVMYVMHEQGYLTDEEYEEATAQELVLRNGSIEDHYICPGCGEQIGEYSLVIEKIDYSEEQMAAMRAEQEQSAAASENAQGNTAAGEEKPLPTYYEVEHCPLCSSVVTDSDIIKESQDYSYFVDTVIRDVVADLMEQTGLDEEACMLKVKTGGYKIYSTIDLEAQRKVDEIYQNVANVPNTTSAQQLQSAIVVVDNASGDIVAMAGGVGVKQGSLTLNRATQSQRQPGSSIKPLTVYGPALEYGVINVGSIYNDSPYENGWPHNEGGGYSGNDITVAGGIAKSLNTIAVRVLADLTPEKSFEFASEKLCMHSLVESEEINGKVFSDIGLAPLGLGGLTHGVTIREMANAYATFPNSGVFREARTYTKVLDSDGNVVLDNEQETHVAMSEQAAWAMSFLLKYAVDTGTGAPARLPNVTVAGKTGTTTDSKDRWFSGFTGYYTASVWCGFDQPEEIILSGSSTNPAVVMWRKTMALLNEGLSNKAVYQGSFTVPKLVAVDICTKSGKVATDACRNDVDGRCVTRKTFVESDVPKETCTEHVAVKWCTEGNAVANDYCASAPGNTVKIIGYYKEAHGVDTSHTCTVHHAPAEPQEPSPNAIRVYTARRRKLNAQQ